MLYSSDSKQRWLDSYHGGWQIMFPNAGNACLYKGAFYGFHGEASMVPWSYHLEQEGSSITVRFSVLLTRTPYQLERVIQMNGADASIHIEETITNRGAVEMQVEWRQHIAFGEPLIGEGCELHIPAGSIRDGGRTLQHVFGGGFLDSVEKGIAMRLQSQESKQFRMKLILMEGVKRVKKIDGSGNIEFFVS